MQGCVASYAFALFDYIDCLWMKSQPGLGFVFHILQSFDVMAP